MDFYKYQRLESSKKGLKSRQVLIWFFLLTVVLFIATVALYGVFIILGQQAGPLVEQKKPQMQFITPAPADIITQENYPVGEMSLAGESSGIYFLYGVFASESSKYKIYKFDYDTRVAKEIFSFSWKDSKKVPSISQFGENIAIYLDVNNGFIIDVNGKISNHRAFAPPYSDFTVSDDGKKIFYFKYLSSIGSKSVVLRDLIKNEDIRIWSSGSEAARDCDFFGWDINNISAYCIYKDGGRHTLRAFNSVSLTYGDINSADSAVDVKVYSDLGYFLKTFASSLVVYNINEKKNILNIKAKAGESFSYGFITPDGKKVLYGVKESVDGSTQEVARMANIDDSEDVKIFENIKKIISISSDSKKILFERVAEDSNVSHYAISNIDGSNQEDLHIVGDIKFIGWLSRLL